MDAVLFDYDDTLVQTKESKFAALKAIAARHYGLALDDESIRQQWGSPYEEFFRALFGVVDEDVARVIRRYEEVDDEFPIEPHSEALDVLKGLRGRVRLGVVTSAGRSIVLPQLARLGVDLQELTILQTAEDTAVHKPDPRVFEPALRTLARQGVTPNGVLYVGDSMRDFEAARGAGMHFYGVLRGTTAPLEFQEAGALCYDSLLPLLTLVQAR